jgi:hypothetical protein
MHVVQMPKKPELRITIPAPKLRLRPIPLRGGTHHDRRRRPRSTERVLRRREDEN